MINVFVFFYHFLETRGGSAHALTQLSLMSPTFYVLIYFASPHRAHAAGKASRETQKLSWK